VDFLSEAAARKWAEEAEAKLTGRIDFFAAFAQAIGAHTPSIHTVLELGSGPGFLAEYLLSRCPAIEHYTLLDFSPTMLDLSRKRLENFASRVAFLQVDFKQAGWPDKVDAVYDSIVTIHSVHELRHKRYALQFYHQCRGLLNANGLLLVCDHVPKDNSERDRALFMTEEEQVFALHRAGFVNIEVSLRTSERVACRASS
jgi:SAM-dependent methyltransferase